MDRVERHWRVDTGQVGAGSKKIVLRTKSCSYIHWVTNTMPGAGPGATGDMDHGYAWYVCRALAVECRYSCIGVCSCVLGRVVFVSILVGDSVRRALAQHLLL